jgi:DNA uptake protein ComE-like DNA-binding protein
VYTFSYEKAKYDKNDFGFIFNLDLNMDTYRATINTFEFNIDGFNFDKGFVEVLDIVKVLDVSGFSLMKYIDEINEINDNAAEKKESIKANLTNNAEAIRANTKLSKFIFDDKILRVLQSNDINTYGQLQKIEDLTSLKGIGAKTAEKIQEFTKK